MKSRLWILLSVFAALAWSAQETLNKVATAPKMVALSSDMAGLFVGIGVLFAVFVNIFLYVLMFYRSILKFYG